MRHIVIIGNGIGGITAARHIRKRSDDRITVIGGESDHFFSRTALMYIYMGHMTYAHTKPYEDGFWARNRIELLRGWVERVDPLSRELHLADGSRVGFDVLLIASGSTSKLPDWRGRDLRGVQGLYSLQDLERMEMETAGIQHAVVVGGGLIGVEMAEMLHSRGIHVTMLVREGHFWGNVLCKEEGELIERHLAAHGIDVRCTTEPAELIDDGKGRVEAARTKDGVEYPASFVGIAIGVDPNIGFLHESGIACDRGVLVNEYLETNVDGIFALGDCAQFRPHPDPERRNIEQVWYTGRMMGETVARTVTGERTPYRPGIWFNSAKFFDIEYQTYGRVPAQVGAAEETLLWSYPQRNVLFRAVFDRGTRRLKGVNAFGLRLRHEVFDRWLREGATIDHVLDHLSEVDFDPELCRRFHREIRASFASRTA